MIKGANSLPFHKNFFFCHIRRFYCVAKTIIEEVNNLVTKWFLIKVKKKLYAVKIIPFRNKFNDGLFSY